MKIKKSMTDDFDQEEFFLNTSEDSSAEMSDQEYEDWLEDLQKLDLTDFEEDEFDELEFGEPGKDDPAELFFDEEKLLEDDPDIIAKPLDEDNCICKDDCECKNN